MIYLFSDRGCLGLAWRLDMSDIDPLDPLQGVVPACSQVGSWDSDWEAKVSTTTSTGWHCTVGSVLLDARFGKQDVYRLDIPARRLD